MSIKDWKNGRKLSEQNAYQEIKDMYFAIDYPFGDNTELMEEQSKKIRHIINQAR